MLPGSLGTQTDTGLFHEGLEPYWEGIKRGMSEVSLKMLRAPFHGNFFKPAFRADQTQTDSFLWFVAGPLMNEIPLSLAKMKEAVKLLKVWKAAWVCDTTAETLKRKSETMIHGVASSASNPNLLSGHCLFVVVDIHYPTLNLSTVMFHMLFTIFYSIFTDKYLPSKKKWPSNKKFTILWQNLQHA